MKFKRTPCDYCKVCYKYKLQINMIVQINL